MPWCHGGHAGVWWAEPATAALTVRWEEACAASGSNLAFASSLESSAVLAQALGRTSRILAVVRCLWRPASGFSVSGCRCNVGNDRAPPQLWVSPES